MKIDPRQRPKTTAAAHLQGFRTQLLELCRSYDRFGWIAVANLNYDQPMLPKAMRLGLGFAPLIR